MNKFASYRTVAHKVDGGWRVDVFGVDVGGAEVVLGFGLGVELSKASAQAMLLMND